MKNYKKDKLDYLQNQIFGIAYQALNNLKIDFTNMANGIKPPHRIKHMSLEDACILLKFYEACYVAADEGKNAKLKTLSRLELDTIIVEDYMDRKLMKLLVEYNGVVEK